MRVKSTVHRQSKLGENVSTLRRPWVNVCNKRATGHTHTLGERGLCLCTTVWGKDGSEKCDVAIERASE